MPAVLTLVDLTFVSAIVDIGGMDLIVLTLMNVCQTHVIAMPAVMTPKGPLSVNVIAGILEMASLVPTLMNAC